MAKKIVIAELDIDVQALLKNTSDLKKELNNIKQAQKDLKKSGDTTSKTFIQNEADIKLLNKAIRLNIKALSDNKQAAADLAASESLLNEVLKQEVTTIEEARQQNKLLNKLRNQTNATTEEGQKQLKLLNDQLDKNNDFIKENADGYLKQKINIGNYKNDVKEAFNELNIFNGGLSGFIQRSTEAGGAGKLFTTSLKAMTKGFLGLTKAALAFIATPIGAVLAALVGAFALIKNALNRSEESTKKLSKAFSAFTGIINAVLKILEPIGKFLIDVLVKNLEFVEQSIYIVIDAFSSLLSFAGFDDLSESVSNFNKEIQNSAKLSKELSDAQADLEKQQRKANLTQLEFQKLAEKQRQIRDDESISINERINANEKLGEILQQQLKEELKIAQLALEVANLRIEAEGKTKEALDEQAEALTNIADIQERITGQESEQLTNRVALQKEAAEKRQERIDKRIEQLEQELEFSKELLRLEEESIEKTRTLAEEEIRILDEKLKEKLISQTEYNTQVLKLENDIKEQQLQNEQAELERIKSFEDKKRALQDEIAIANAESESEKRLLKAEQDFENHVLELENLQLREEEKTELLRLLEEQRQQVLDDIIKQNEEKRLEDYKAFSEAEIAARQANAQEVQNIASQLTSILSGLLGDSLGAQLAGIAIDGAVQAGLVKITSAASQARNLANAAASAPPPINAANIGIALKQNALIGANSTKAISKIAASSALKGLGAIASKIKLEKGGIVGVGGKRHAQGGTKFYGEDGTMFEAEKGEGIGVLNRSAFSSFMDFNNSFNGGKSRTGFMQGGGILTQTIPLSDNNLQNQFETLSDTIKQMKIQVAVEDINTGQGNFAEVVTGADLG